MLISKIMGAIASKTHPIGELYKESPNGIKIFRHIKKDGTVVLSSFFADETPFKTITKKPFIGFNVGNHKIVSSSTGHTTTAENHKTGISTVIKKIQTSFDLNDVYKFDSHMARKMNKGEVINSYEVKYLKGSNNIGNCSYKAECQDAAYQRDLKFDDSGNLLSSEINFVNFIA